MVVKERTIPLRILILEAILRRLPFFHVKRAQIMDELKRRHAGYKGEQSLDFYFSKLPEKDYMIFHDLNLPDGDYNCQIDTLILTPQLTLVIEVKNMAGKLVFDFENEQLIQFNEEKEKGYPYPVSQVERHQACIKNLLKENHLTPIPVEYLIVVSNPYTILAFHGRNPHAKLRICKSDSLFKKIQLLESIHTDKVLSSKELRKLSKLLIRKNTPPTTYLLQKYGLLKDDFLTGVFCPFCSHLPMIRQKKKWFCPSCKTYSLDAHIYNVQDYFLLYDTKITNKQFREFVRIESPDVSGRILRSLTLKSSGKNRDRVYFPETIPWDYSYRR